MLPRESVGIILQRRIFRETDLIVTFYGELEGRLSGLAFGALRSRVRFQNCLDLFSKSLVRYTARPGRELVRLESCDLIDARLGFETRNGPSHTPPIWETWFCTSRQRKMRRPGYLNCWTRPSAGLKEECGGTRQPEF